MNFVNNNSIEVDLISLEKALFNKFYFWSFIPTAREFETRELEQFMSKTQDIWNLLADKFVERINNHLNKEIVLVKL